MMDRRKTLHNVSNRMSYGAPAGGKPSRASMAGPLRGAGVGAGAGAGVAPSERRRSSMRMSHGGRGAMADPRPLKKKAFLEGEAARLMDALMHGTVGPYPYQVHDMVRKGGPTGRQFKEMVVFLFQQLDPSFRIETSIDKDIPEAFRVLKYPFPISKNSLHAVGSPHTWPQLLVALTWLLDLVQLTRMNVDAKESDPDTSSRRHISHHTRRSYAAFLQADDAREDELLIADKGVVMEEIAAIDGDVEAADAEIAKLREQLEELTSAKTRLPEMREVNARYRNDLEKMQSFVEEQEKYQRTMGAKLADTRALVATKDREIVAARDHVADLERRRDAQELSAADVQRMRQDGELLKDGIRAAREAHEATQGQLHVLDREYQRGLAEVKDAVTVYNDDVAPVAKVKDSDAAAVRDLKARLGLDVAFSAADATPKLLNSAGEGPKDVKASLKKLEKAFHTEALDLVMKAQTVEAKVEAAADGKADRSKANALLQEQLRKLEEALAQEKSTLEGDMDAAGKEMEAVQTRTEELRAAIAGLTASSDGLDAGTLSKLAAAVKAEEVTLAKERGKLHNAIVAAMSKLTKHVSHVQGSLSSGVQDVEAVLARMPTFDDDE